MPDPLAWILLAAVAGLMVGSFINVLVWRLPQIMERQWREELAAQADLPAAADAPHDAAAAFVSSQGAPRPREASLSLWRPGSACPLCGHRLAWVELVPVLSWAIQGGRCRHCGGRISARYPLVEIATALVWAWAAWRWGPAGQALAWAGMCTTLLALALIDWDTTLLPDVLTLPLLWAGMAAASLGLTGITLETSFWGAVGGYGVLWVTCQGFFLVTGREGMGQGDFKLLAALGAWFGWPALVPVLLLASLAGLAGGLALRVAGGLREGGYFPFGPFLVLAGLVNIGFGPFDVRTFLGV